MSAAGEALRRYRDVIGAARGPVAGYLLNGVAISLKPLAAVFLLREYGSPFDLIGLVLAAEVVGTAAGMPILGRLIDRYGPRRVLLPLAFAHVVALSLFVAAVTGGASAWQIVALTALWGASQPLLLPSLRALWGTLFSDAQRSTAYAMQAVLTETMFITGPLLAALITVVVSPAAALLVAAAMSLAGAIVFGATAKRRPVDPAAPTPRRWNVLAAGRIRALLTIGVLGGVTSGAIEIVLPAFAEQGGATERAGIAFAALAAGSVVGGLFYGARDWTGSVIARYATLSMLLGVALLPLTAAPPFVAVCVVVFIAGLWIAPAEACLFGLLDDTADDASVVEANSWLTAAYTAGLGVGAGAGGWVLEQITLGAAAALPGLAALLAAVLIAAILPRTAPRAVEDVAA